MTRCKIRSDRRNEPRVEASEVMRWKRPGKVEDHKAWMVDRSASGFGFLAMTQSAPRVGEILNLRRLDRDRWATVDRIVRVARTTPTSNNDLVLIGCRIE